MFCICVIANVTCVLLKCLPILHLCRHNRIVGSAFNVSLFCICVVSNVFWVLCKCLRVLLLCRHKGLPCVLFKLLQVLHLCCPKRTMCSVQLFVQVAFVLSQTYNVFCSIVCISCISVVTNVPCILLKCSLVLQLCRHNRLVGPVVIKLLYVLRLCRHKRIMGSF